MDIVTTGVATMDGRELATTALSFTFTAVTRSTPFSRGVLETVGPVAAQWGSPIGVVVTSPEVNTLSDANAGEILSFVLATTSDLVGPVSVQSILSAIVLLDSTGAAVGRGLGGSRSTQGTFQITLDR